MKAYLFSELKTRQAKDAALEWARNHDWAWDGYQNEQLTEDFEEQLKEVGFTDLSLNWSLSCCQGDGVEINKASFDVDDLKDEGVQEAWKAFSTAHTLSQAFSDEEDYNYLETCGHVSSGQAEFCMSDYSYERESLRKLWHDVEGAIQSMVKDWEYKLEKQGYEQIDYCGSEECLKESLDANEVYFNYLGERTDRVEVQA